MQIVEDHQLAELERRVDGAADRGRDQRPDADGGHRGDRRAGRDLVGQPGVTGAVARDVGHRHPGEDAAGHVDRAVARLDRLHRAVVEALELVEPGAGDESDRGGVGRGHAGTLPSGQSRGSSSRRVAVTV